MEKYYTRSIAIKALLIIVFAIYGARCFYLQILQDELKAEAESNVLREKTIYPSRGLILDRNNKLIAFNQPLYDIMVIPNAVKDIDTLLFCQLLNINEKVFNQRMTKAKSYSYSVPSVFLKQIPAHTFSKFQEYLFQFSGFYEQVRTSRGYTHPTASHILGYLSEIDQNGMKNDKYYELGDYVGVAGIEKQYEKHLRGERGIEFFLADVHNSLQGSYKEGRFDKNATAGMTMISTIDLDLQVYASQLLKNKRGSVVAIEPATGEVLAFLSSPEYDPNYLSIGQQRNYFFDKLKKDTLKPLFNRATMAQYPPGSILKPLLSAIALQEEVWSTEKTHFCPGYYKFRNLTVKCHSHQPRIKTAEAIKYSCNSYYCQMFSDFFDKPKFDNDAGEALTLWRKYLMSFGLGKELNIDIENGKSGNLPEATYYDKIYRKGSWKAPTVISLGIGQGEMLVTPLQMANMTAAIANKGFYYDPHFAKMLLNDSSSVKLKVQRNQTMVESDYFQPIIDGMELVVIDGTARVAQIKDVQVCGKTGTAENPHGEDHSVFVAFAPKDNPKIAISVIVENGTWGSTYGAPIASLMIEQYLNDTIATNRKWLEQRMFESDLITVNER